jgi:hypothetical protein
MTFSGLQLSTTVDEFPETEAPMVGEEMILFLAPSETDSGKFRLSGNAFGAFRIIEGKGHGTNKCCGSETWRPGAVRYGV